jgi:hypothetical protein
VKIHRLLNLPPVEDIAGYWELNMFIFVWYGTLPTYISLYLEREVHIRGKSPWAVRHDAFVIVCINE